MGDEVTSERDRLRDLVTHMEWADAMTWKTVLATTGAERDQRLIYLLHHYHLVQQIYLQMWRREPPRVPEMSAFATVASVAAWARPYYADALAFVDTLEPAALDQAVEFPWTEQIAKRFGSVGPVSLREAVWQVVMHSTYHRAQVATRVRELGGEPATTDLVVWVWKQRPAAEW